VYDLVSSAIKSLFAGTTMLLEVPWQVRLEGNYVLPCARAMVLFGLKVLPKFTKQNELAWSAEILGPILETLGARGPGNCRKHLENIAGCGSNFLQCNCQIHVENI
jgi:hypothetical protein